MITAISTTEILRISAIIEEGIGYLLSLQQVHYATMNGEQNKLLCSIDIIDENLMFIGMHTLCFAHFDNAL